MTKKRNPANGKPELDDGYLKLANELVDQFVKLKITATQWNILFLVMRETYGYNRKSKDLSVSYIAKAICASEFRTRKAVQELLGKKILVEYAKPTSRTSREIGINKYYFDWVWGNASVTSGVTDTCPHASVTSGVTDTCPLGVTEALPKQRQYKDNIKNNKPAASRQDYSTVEQEYFGDW